MIRVLELGAYWAGPMVGQFLSTVGCEVVKIEAPDRPDPVRRMPPPRLRGQAVPGARSDANPYFDQINAGKRSVALDVTNDGDRKAFFDLVASSNAVVENYAPGRMAQLGLDWPSLLAWNPTLVMLSLPALHAEDGDYAGIRGYAPVFTAIGGAERLAGYPDETTGMLRTAWGDLSGGSLALAGLLAALVRQARTGCGSHVVTSQVKSVTYQLAVPLEHWRGTVVDSSRWSAILPTRDPDEWVAVAGERTQALAISGQTNGEPSDAEAHLHAWAKLHTERDLCSKLEGCGLATARVERIDDAARSDRMLQSAMSAVLSYPGLGTAVRFGVPWRINGTIPRCDESAELLGASSAAFLDQFQRAGGQ